MNFAGLNVNSPQFVAALQACKALVVAPPVDQAAQIVKRAEAVAQCMRKHGVPNFPDPQISTNGNEVKVAMRVTPGITGNPNFQSAQKACNKLLPNGGSGAEGNHQISPQEQSQFLKAAACIRSA